MIELNEFKNSEIEITNGKVCALALRISGPGQGEFQLLSSRDNEFVLNFFLSEKYIPLGTKISKLVSQGNVLASVW